MVFKFKKYLELLYGLRSDNKHLTHQHFIIGNTSADFDSFYGSLIYGYMKYLLFNTLFIPLIDCPKEQVQLRFEIGAVLDRYNIDYHKLFYHSEFPDLNTRQSVLLYDHNVREGIKPAEIIDHHTPKDTLCQRKIILHCASALTLLYYTLHPQQLSPNETKWFEAYSNYLLPVGEQPDNEVDELIRMGIYLDSFNFDKKQTQRWTDMDIKAAQSIQSRAGTKTLLTFEQLELVKFDVKRNCELSLPLIMQKDYKLIKYSAYKIAYSIILLPPHIFLKNYGEQNVLKYQLNQLKQQGIDCYFCMFLFEKEKKYCRELAFSTQNSQLAQKLERILLSMKMNKLSDQKKVLRTQHWVDPSGIISRKIIDKQFNNDLKNQT